MQGVEVKLGGEVPPPGPHLQGQKPQVRPVIMGKEEWFFHLTNIQSLLMILPIQLICHR